MLILGPKNGFFINYKTILRCIWDLGGLLLFDSPKDLVPVECLFFGIIFVFLGVNWAQKWIKTVSFGYVLFPVKNIILKDCSYTAFIL